jgi:hypothetical protein
MAFLGKLKRSEEIPINLTLDAAPTGTPQYRILDSDGTQTAALANLEGSGLYWYLRTTAATVPASGQGSVVGSYSIEYVAVIDGVTRYAHDNFEVTINETDDVKDDTETIIANLGVSVGIRSIILNIKDSVPNPLSDVSASFHNSNNDDSPAFGIRVSDTLGVTSVINLNDATYTLRLLKNGVVNENQTIVVTKSETFTITVTPVSVTTPANPSLCRVHFFPADLGFTDISDAKVRVRTATDLALVGGIYIDHREQLMVVDTDTTPDRWYIDVIQGTVITIISSIFGFNHTITVPAQASLDISTLITS